MSNNREMTAVVVAIAAAFAGAGVFITIQREVNRCLPPKERYPFFELGLQNDYGRALKILRDHKRFYPDDCLPLLYWCFNGLGVLAFLFAVLNSMRNR